MTKRIALWTVMVLTATLGAVTPATTASACKLGCLEDSVTVSPHTGYGGAAWTFQVITLHWTVTNNTNHLVDVAVSPGATECAVKEVPYVSPSELILDAHETLEVESYVTGDCQGAGRAWLSAGQDQGYQDVWFN